MLLRAMRWVHRQRAHFRDNSAMNILALDTSTQHASIALRSGEASWQAELPNASKTSATIIPRCLEALEALSLSFADLHAIVYTKGPGAFTGLRTAVSVAQGFALAQSIPTLGFSTLQCLAQTARLQGHAHERVVCALDARMQQVYWGSYRWHPQQWVCHNAPQLASESASQWPQPWQDMTSPTLIVGNALAVNAQQVPLNWGANLNLTWCFCEPSALGLLVLAQQYLASREAAKIGQGDDAVNASPRFKGPPEPPFLDPVVLGRPTPWYLRDQVAQTTLERAQAHALTIPQVSSPDRDHA